MAILPVIEAGSLSAPAATSLWRIGRCSIQPLAWASSRFVLAGISWVATSTEIVLSVRSAELRTCEV